MELENKPKENNLSQQRIRPWKWEMSTRQKAFFYLGTGVFFVVAGVLVILASERVKEHRKEYGDLDRCKVKTNETCYLDFDIGSDMKGDVFLYYEIHGLYQNHRAYSKSLSVEQMLGHTLNKNEAEKVCDPVVKVKDLHHNPKNFPSDKVANPCGLISNSYFTDSFELIDSKNKAVRIHEDDIAFSIDKDEKFKGSNDKRWVDVKNG